MKAKIGKDNGMYFLVKRDGELVWFTHTRGLIGYAKHNNYEIDLKELEK